jgi:hypothetical protein
MAQVVKLKRTAVEGKVPSTSNLELGELAINTYDGRIFFEKDNGTPSIQQVVTTDAITTGSLNVTGQITASVLYGAIYSTNGVISGSSQLTSSFDSRYLNVSGEGTISGSFTGSFSGDGSNLTNLVVDIAEVSTVNSSFSNSSNFSVSHNFGTRNIIVSVYDNGYAQIIPTSVTLTDDNTVTITLSSAQSGYVVVAKGGHIVSGAASDSNRLNGQLGSYYLDYTNFTNVPSGIVSGSSQVVSLLPNGVISGSSQVNLTQTTNYVSGIKDRLNAETVVSGSSQINFLGISSIPTNIVSSSTDSSTVDFSITNGVITAELIGGVISGSSQVISSLPTGTISGSGQVVNSLPIGTVSGSSQVIGILDSLNSYSSSLKTAFELTGSNVVVLGDLSVRGTTTTINSTTIQLDDNIISLNAAGTTNGGLIVRDATGGNTNSGSIVWDVNSDYWKAGISGSESKVLLSNGDSVVSGSSQIDFTQTTGYTSYSSSVDSRIISLNLFSSSEESKNSTLATYTSSIDGKFTTLANYTGSNDNKWSTLQSVTSSLISATSSYEVKGSGIVSSSTQIVSSLINQSVNLGSGAITASYFKGDGSQITNVVTEIAEVATVTSSFDNQSSFVVTHNFNSKNVIVSVYDNTYAQLIPTSVTLTNDNSVTITLSSAQSGYAVVAKGGHIVSGSTEWANLANKPSGLISGSSQITNLTTYKESVTGNSVYSITHSLNEEYPIVQAWNTSTKRQEVPSIIESLSANAISVTFSSNFSGLVIVKK